jgi:hypothetical protein
MPDALRARKRDLAADVTLLLAGLADLWFVVVCAAAYVLGPEHVCFAAFPGGVCSAIGM